MILHLTHSLTAVAIRQSGYAATDIIQTLFRVTRTMDMPEPQKLEFIREIGFTHMRMSEGLNSQLQLMGCVARLCGLQHRQMQQVQAAVR